MQLVLASASPRRLELLAQIGLVPAQTLATDIDESLKRGETPEALAERLSRAKADAARSRFPEDVILAADTVVACGRRALGKPSDESEARAMLELLSGRRHRVHTAVTVTSPRRMINRLVTTMVQMKRLSPNELDAYLASREWEGKAGAYAIQGNAASFIPRINGSYSNVVGLPLAETAAMLHSAGLSLQRIAGD